MMFFDKRILNRLSPLSTKPRIETTMMIVLML